MAILQTSKKSWGPSKTQMAFDAMGAFAGGLAKGIQANRDIAIANARTQLAQQEMQLRQRALQHGLDREEDVQQWSQAYGGYKAWRAGSDDEITVPGQQQVGADDDLGAAEAHGGAMSPARQIPNQPEIDRRLMDLARSIPSERARDAFLETIAHEEKVRSSTKARDTLAAEIKDRRLQKGYRSTTIDGAEDPSGDELAMSFEEQLAGADPETDPEGLAALTDKIRDEDRKHRLHVAGNNFKIGQRAKKDMDLDTAIATREQTPGIDTTEARQVQALWRAHIIPDEMLEKLMPLALNGTLALNLKMAQQQQRIQQLELEKLERERLPGGSLGIDRSRPRPPSDSAFEADFGGKNRTRAKASMNGDDPLVRRERASRIAANEVGDLEETNAPGARRKRIDELLGGGEAPKADPATEFLARIQGGEFQSEDALQAALKEAGLTEADIEAAAGNK